VERIKNGEFTWADVIARDLDAQSTFYESLFGWTHEDFPYDGGVYRMFKDDERTVAGISQMPPEQMQQRMPSTWNIYIVAEDVDKTVAKAAELGAKTVMPPMDVPGFGRMAGIEDPTGAYIFLWKAVGTNESMEYGPPGTLAWFDLTTRDPQRAIEFYTKLLGWEVEKLEAGQMPYWRVKVNGEGQGGIMPMPDSVPPEVPSYWMAYVGVADARASADKAKDLGAKVVVDAMPVGDMLIFAVLQDPEGATFALLQPLMPG
jgi:uncharacterized protein